MFMYYSVMVTLLVQIKKKFFFAAWLMANRYFSEGDFLFVCGCALDLRKH